MKGVDTVAEKCPVLLCEDLRYALKQFLSIIKDDDYEDLGNHATEAMGETGLFSLVQVCLTILLTFVLSNRCLILTSTFESCRGSS